MDKATREFLNVVDLQHAATSSAFKPLELLSMLSALIWLRIESSKANDAPDSSAFEQPTTYRSTPSSQVDGISLPEELTSIAPSTRLPKPAPGLEQALHRLSILPESYRAVIEAYADSLPLNAENGPAESLEILDSIIVHYQQQYPRDIQTTPRLVADLMAALVEPKPGETIYDPCCGLGGLLLACSQAVKQGDGCILNGADIDPDSCLLAAVRFFLSGTKYWNLNNHDSLSKAAMNAQVDIAADIVLATPPWGEFEQTAADDLSTSTISEALFSQHLVDSLKPGGRGVIAVPDDFLSRQSYSEVRVHLAVECTIQGVISLPMGVYLPWSNRKISLLVVTKKGNTQKAAADLPVRMMVLPEHQWRRASAFPASAETASFISDTVQRFKKGETVRHIWERPLATVEKFNMNLEALRNPEEVLTDLLNKIKRASLQIDIITLDSMAKVYSGMSIDHSQLTTIPDGAQQKTAILRLADLHEKDKELIAYQPVLYITASGTAEIHDELFLHKDDIVLAILDKVVHIVDTSKIFENNDSVNIIVDSEFIFIRPNEAENLSTISFIKTKEYRNLLSYYIYNDFNIQGLIQKIKGLLLPSLLVDFIFYLVKKYSKPKTILDNFSLQNYFDYLLQTEESPVIQWLESSSDNQSSINHDPLHLIDKLAESYLRIPEGRKDMDPGLEFWKNHMAGVMKRLSGISSVPSGPVRYLLLDNAKERLSYILYEMFAQFEFNLHPRLEKLSDLASNLMEKMQGDITTEQETMLANSAITFSIHPTNCFLGNQSNITLHVENSGELPFRNLRVSTDPDFGGMIIPYFTENGKAQCNLLIPPYNQTGTKIIYAWWEGLRIDGIMATGRTPVVIQVQKYDPFYEIINQIILGIHSKDVIDVAAFMLKKNDILQDFSIKGYQTKVPDIRFALFENETLSKDRPFLIFKRNMEIHVFLTNERAKKYHFLEFSDTQNGFFRVNTKDGMSLPLEILIQLADDAFHSRYLKNQITDETKMLKKDIVSKIDNLLLNINTRSNAFLVKKEDDSLVSGTAYAAYNFRQALLGLPSELIGKTKQEIQLLMFKKTKRNNMQPYYYLIKALKESRMPIEVIYGKDKPFQVIYHDRSIIQDDLSPSKMDLSETDFGISPYIVGKPVDVEYMFFGRQDVIQSIQRQLSTEHKANVVLLEGNRRTGKSSILKQLAKEDVLPKWVVVNCSFQAGDSTSGGLSTNEVFRLMAREIGRSVIKAGFQPWLPDQPAPDQAKKIEPQFIKALHQAFSTDYPMETFEMYLQNVINAIKPRRLLLMLDEFDKLQEGIDAGVTSPSVPENIRYLLHTYDFTAILAGSRRIKRLRDEYWSALFGLGHRIGISALELDDARELVTRPVEGRLHYVDEARDRVVELCAGHPFLIQSLCTRVFEFAARKVLRNITLDIVEAAAREMIADNEHFRTLWGYSGTETRRFLLSLCARLQSEPDPLSMSFLQEKLGQEGIRMEHDSLGSDIDFLIELELIVRDATSRTAIYSIGMPLMTMWITTHIDHAEQRNRATKEIKETS